VCVSATNILCADEGSKATPIYNGERQVSHTHLDKAGALSALISHREQPKDGAVMQDQYFRPRPVPLVGTFRAKDT
jgi:hypothetical protein